jgi:hypothetical protein
MNESSELTGIKMAPYPFFAFIINRTRFTTFGADAFCRQGIFQVNIHFLSAHIEICFDDLPGLYYAQNLSVRFFVIHIGNISNQAIFHKNPGRAIIIFTIFISGMGIFATAISLFVRRV